MVLLALTLAAFGAQQRWLGRRSYATLTGKGDAGCMRRCRARLRGGMRSALPWALFTAPIYAMILFGGFVEAWGADHRLSLATTRRSSASM